MPAFQLSHKLLKFPTFIGNFPFLFHSSYIFKFYYYMIKRPVILVSLWNRLLVPWQYYYKTCFSINTPAPKFNWFQYRRGFPLCVHTRVPAPEAVGPRRMELINEAFRSKISILIQEAAETPFVPWTNTMERSQFWSRRQAFSRHLYQLGSLLPWWNTMTTAT